MVVGEFSEDLDRAMQELSHNPPCLSLPLEDEARQLDVVRGVEADDKGGALPREMV